MSPQPNTEIESVGGNLYCIGDSSSRLNIVKKKQILIILHYWNELVVKYCKKIKPFFQQQSPKEKCYLTEKNVKASRIPVTLTFLLFQYYKILSKFSWDLRSRLFKNSFKMINTEFST